jgi:ubiquinone/menaquinone biosynthesis C-methylase UbiE
MFSHTAQYYDTIYLAMKDYGAEADKLTAFIRQYSRSTGHRLLDVACGTGLISPTSNTGSRSRDSILTSSYSPSLVNETRMSHCITRT